MLLTERSTTETDAAQAARRPVSLRVSSGAADEQLIPIAVGKHSIGSGPRCSVRLQEPGVRPMHCLIVRDAHGVRVRRWAIDTLLNGEAFDESPLVSGDVLSVGSVEMRVVCPSSPIELSSSGATQSGQTEVPTDDAGRDSQQPDVETHRTSPTEASLGNVDKAAGPETLIVPQSTLAPNEEGRLSQQRRRKLKRALRSHYSLGMDWAHTIEALEQTVHECVVERNKVQSELARVHDELATRGGQSRQINTTAKTAGRLFDDVQRLAIENTRLGDEIQQLAASQSALADGTNDLSGTLSTLCQQVETQLGDVTRISEEQADWHDKYRVWESRLDDQTEQLQKLHDKVDADRAARTVFRSRGRKLVATLRQHRDTSRQLAQRIEELERQLQEASAARDGLRGELSSVRGQLEAVTSEDERVAWAAVVDATDRLSDNYRQLAAENQGFASEIEKFSQAQAELAAEKTATSSTLDAIREELQEVRRQQAGYHADRGQAEQQRQAWEQTISDCLQRIDDFQRQVDELRSEQNQQSAQTPMLAGFSEQVEELGRQLGDLHQSRAAWESRMEESESRWTENLKRFDAFQREVESLRSAHDELQTHTVALASLPEEYEACCSRLANSEAQLANSEAKVESLRQKLAEHEEVFKGFAAEQSEWQGQLVDWESRLVRYVERIQELGTPQDQAGEPPTDERSRPSEPVDAAIPVSDVDRRDTESPQSESAGNLFLSQAPQTDPSDLSSDEDRGTYDWSAHQSENATSTVEVPHEIEGNSPEREATLFDETGDPPTTDADDMSSSVTSAPAIWDWSESDPYTAEPASENFVTDEPCIDDVVAEPVTGRADAGAEATEPAGAADSRTASFIDRYAHLFEDEESAEPSPSPPLSEPLPTADPGPMADSIEPPAAQASSTEPATAGDDEDSIEQYMAKMMSRLRGDLSSAPASQAPPPAEVPGPSGGASAGASDPAAAAATRPTLDSLVVGRPQRKRGPAPEQNTDMAALRALANRTARHAIGVHTAGKMRRRAVTRFIIAMLAGTMSLYFFLAAPGWDSLQFVTASVALVASIYWGLLTLGSLIQAVREGAFEDHEPEFAVVEPLIEPLPIDLDH